MRSVKINSDSDKEIIHAASNSADVSLAKEVRVLVCVNDQLLL